MAKSKGQLITQLEDAMREVAKIQGKATNFINCNEISDPDGKVVSRTHINGLLEDSTRTVLDALKEAKAFIDLTPFDHVG